MKRVPAPLWAFLAAFLIQAALLGWLIVDRALLLARGTEIRLAVEPVDPRDFLRGDYVILSYAISRLDAGALDGDDELDESHPVFVTLRQDGDVWVASGIYRDPPAGAFGIAGWITRGGNGSGTACAGRPCPAYRVVYDLEKFFVPEGQGRALETMRNDHRLQVDVAVGSGGRAAVKRLLVDGTPVFAETLF